ncbi:MAG TPA: cellulase family glycosylhydrolase [Pseudomonadota bacterium]|nr:cellulase family glycosylhydrolase [Pseudomonadota bacterium]
MRHGVSLFVWLVFGLMGCSDVQTARTWHVEGGFLRDPDDRIALLRGINLSSEHKTSPYLGPHKPSDFQRLYSYGFRSIRFLLSWAALEKTKGTINETYLDEVERRVEWAEQAGLLVVFDMHQDVFGVGFGHNGAPRWVCDEEKYAAHKKVEPWFLEYLSPPVRACFDKLWTDPELVSSFSKTWGRVAQKFAARRNVIGFDIINEPSPGTADTHTFESDRLWPFYERVIEEVRSAAPHWIAFVEPALTRNLGMPSSLPSMHYKNIVYAPHNYDALAEQGKGFDDSRRAALLMNVQELAMEASRMNAALWIGEYGGIANHPGIVEYMDAQYDAVAEVGAASMYWDASFGPGYGLFEQDGIEKKTLLDALLRPYPIRVSGDSLSYSYDERSGCFSTRYTTEKSISVETELFVPRAVYPHGYTVSCSGCVYSARGDVLVIESPPLESSAHIRICPVAVGP